MIHARGPVRNAERRTPTGWMVSGLAQKRTFLAARRARCPDAIRPPTSAIAESPFRQLRENAEGKGPKPLPRDGAKATAALRVPSRVALQCAHRGARIHPGRRVHHDAVRGQPRRRRARRHGPQHRGDAAVRELDESVRDDVRPAADRARGRLPGAHLHAHRRAPRSRATRRSAPATPGSPSAAARPSSPTWSCRSAPRG